MKKNHTLYLTNFIFAGTLFLCVSPAMAGPVIREPYYTAGSSEYFTPDKLKLVPADDLAKKIQLKSEKKIDLQIVDLRLEADFAQGAIPGAVNIPLNRKLRFLADKLLVKSQPLVVYGYSSEDKASVNAVIFLFNKGYRQVMLFEGGWKAWEERDRLIKLK